LQKISHNYFLLNKKNRSEIRRLHRRVTFPDLAMKGFCAIRY